MKEHRPTVVIVGAGFGGLNAARRLARLPVEVVLIDRQNYHLFQPLLYQVATAGLSPSEIAYPVRAIFRKQSNLSFRMTEVTGADLERRLLFTVEGPVAYDYLILAPGSQTNYFGLASVQQNAFDLKSLQDAEKIRNHILSMFEAAALTGDEAERRALLSFVVVGGGPTGVECAGALTELVDLALRKDFTNVDISPVRVILLEAAGRLLAGFPDDLGRRAAEKLHQKRVEVQFGAAVAAYDGRRVMLKDGRPIDACTLIWAAGVRGSSLLERMGLATGRQGRALVELTLQVAGRSQVFIIGDSAYLEDGDGAPLPMVAPVAIQQAETAARNIAALLAGRAPEAFAYKDPGALATIGRNAAVARIGRFQFHGFVAWVVWLTVHLLWLIGFRNRLVTMINWAWDYFLYERGIRLISEPARPRPPAPKASADA